MRVVLASLSVLAAVAALSPHTAVRLEWLLLGSELGIDAVNRPIIIAAGLAWALAAFALPAAPLAVKLATLGVVLGNALAIFALDHATLFTGFALMSLSAYGFFLPLSQEARRSAARTYVSYAIVAEVLLFSAMLALVGSSGGATPGWAAALVIAGFGIKAGLVPIHGTLPMSYRHVSVAAAVLLGGGALNAAVLGWLRWLGDVELADPAALGEVLAWLGALGFVFAVALGFTQGHPRAILGYSSVSQVALITIVLGCSLASGSLNLRAAETIALMALFHSVAKSALFVASAGCPQARSWRALWWLVVVVACASLGGMAMTAGYLAKDTLTGISAHVFGPIAGALVLTGPMSVALLTWFVVTVRNSAAAPQGTGMAAALAVAGVGAIALTLWASVTAPVSLASWLSSALPLIAAVLLVAPFNAWAGRERATCGDFAVLVSDSLFQLSTRRWTPALSREDLRRRLAQLLDPKRELHT